jgi:multisubunit Na+/H+ antiporter MnhC subunit
LQHSASAQPLWQPVVVTAAEAVVVTAVVAGVAVRERALPQCPEVARDL